MILESLRVRRTFLGKCISKIKREAEEKALKFETKGDHARGECHHFAISNNVVVEVYGVNSEKRKKYPNLIFVGYPQDIYDKFSLQPGKSFLLVADGINQKCLVLPFDIIKNNSRLVSRRYQQAITIKVNEDGYTSKKNPLNSYVDSYDILFKCVCS